MASNKNPIHDFKEEMTLHDCADKCYFDRQCTGFRYCYDKCENGHSFQPYQRHCILIRDALGGEKKSANFVTCIPEGLYF